MSLENWLVVATMGAYLIFMLWVGRRTSHNVVDLDSYILAGRNLPWYVLAMTLLATVGSTVQLLGQPGIAYRQGLSLMFWEKIAVITTMIVFVIPLARRLRGLRASTIVDVVLARFPHSRRLHFLMTVIQLIWGVFVAALSVFGGSLLIALVTGLPLPFSLAIIVGVTLIYTVLGGLSAVVVTDSVQWGIIILGSAIFLPLLYFAVGPYTSFFSSYLGSSGFDLTAAAEGTTLAPGFSDIYSLQVPLLTAIAFLITSGGLGAVDPSFAQRILAARSDREGRLGLYVFAILYLLVMILILVIGMYGAALRPGLDNPDQIILVMAQDYLPLFGKALFLTAVAAAAMSTISSYLNVTAGIFVKNILMVLKPDLTSARQVMWARLITVVVALAALCFAPIASTGLTVAAVATQLILISAIGPLIYLTLFWPRLTEQGAFWGTSVTIVVTGLFIVLAGSAGAAVLGPGVLGLPVQFWGFIAAALSFVGVSRLTRRHGEVLPETFRALFAQPWREVLPSRRAFTGLGLMWTVLLIPGIWEAINGYRFALPPLSGPFAWLTDLTLFAITIVVIVASLAMLWLLVVHLRKATGKGVQSPPEAERSTTASHQ